MCDENIKHKNRHPRFHVHPPPFMFKRPYRMRHPMMHNPLPGYSMRFVKDIENKEEAIEFLEMQTKLVNKRRQRINKELQKMDEIENHLEAAIKEIGAMKEFSQDEMKKILKKHYRDFTKRMLDED